MAKKTRNTAEYVAHKTDELVSQGLPPPDEARELLRLLAKADDQQFWRGFEPWPGDVEIVFEPIIERLTDLGEDAVDAVLDLEPTRESWQADLAASILAHLLREGEAKDRVADAVYWGLRWGDNQGEGFNETMEEVTSRAGPVAEDPLTRYVEEHEGDEHAAVMASFALQDADPEWACGAATRMTRKALDGGDLRRADALSLAAAMACGHGAVPLIGEVLDRMSAEGVDRNPWRPGAFEGSLLLGVHPGSAWGEEVERTLDGMTLEEYSVKLEDEDVLGAVAEGGGHLERRELARACRLLDLDDGGSKPELLERLDGAFEVHGTDDQGRLPAPRLEGFSTARLRDMCRALRLDAVGPRADLLGRLRKFQEDVVSGSGREYSRQELDGMSLVRLRVICEELGLDPGGKRRALVARIQLAQEAEH